MTGFDLERDDLGELAAEFTERLRRGERPSVEEYAERCPASAEEVRELFPTIELMELAKVGRGHSSDGRASLGASRPERLGDFHILREVGRGGMGIVFEAEQESLGRRVAVKVLPRLAPLDPRRLERFRQEARIVARLHHTNILPAYGVGEQEGFHYYVMPLVPRSGRPAPRRQAGEPPPGAGRPRLGQRLRPGEGAGGRRRGDLRRPRRHAAVPGAGSPRRAPGRAQRRLRLGADSVRVADAAPGVPRPGPRPPRPADRRGRVQAAARPPARLAARPGDGRAEGGGARAAPPLRDGGRVGRRPALQLLGRLAPSPEARFELARTHYLLGRRPHPDPALTRSARRRAAATGQGRWGAAGRERCGPYHFPIHGRSPL